MLSMQIGQAYLELIQFAFFVNEVVLPGQHQSLMVGNIE